MRRYDRKRRTFWYSCDWPSCAWAEFGIVEGVGKINGAIADSIARDRGWTGGRYGWRCPRHANRQTNHVHRSKKGARA